MNKIQSYKEFISNNKSGGGIRRIGNPITPGKPKLPKPGDKPKTKPDRKFPTFNDEKMNG